MEIKKCHAEIEVAHIINVLELITVEPVMIKKPYWQGNVVGNEGVVAQKRLFHLCNKVILGKVWRSGMIG